MDSRLRSLIEDFTRLVRNNVLLLVHELQIELPTSATAWAFNGMPQIGTLGSGRVRYFKHGIGIRFCWSEGKVDFDFGEGGEFDGFLFFWLRTFAGIVSGRYGYAKDNGIWNDVMEAYAAGELRCRYDSFFYIANESMHDDGFCHHL